MYTKEQAKRLKKFQKAARDNLSYFYIASMESGLYGMTFTHAGAPPKNERDGPGADLSLRQWENWLDNVKAAQATWDDAKNTSYSQHWRWLFAVESHRDVKYPQGEPEFSFKGGII